MEQAETEVANTESAQTDSQNTPRETIQDNERSKPAGYDPVDISDLPEEKQKVLNDRFGYFMRQIREFKTKSDASERSIREWQDNAAKQIQELTSGVGQIVDHMETRTIGESEDQIKRELKEAFEAGDSVKHADAVTRLAEIQQKKLALQKKEQKQEPQKNPTQEQAHAGYPDAYSIAGEAVANGEIGPEDLDYVGAWQNERDAQGNLVRPWAYSPTPVPQPGSPMDTAMKEIVSMLQSPYYSKMSFKQILGEVDKRMGVRTMNGSQTVMGGTLTKPQKTNTVKLSPDIEKMAVRMKFGGPNAKSDADHVKAYQEAMKRAGQRSR